MKKQRLILWVEERGVFPASGATDVAIILTNSDLAVIAEHEAQDLEGLRRIWSLAFDSASDYYAGFGIPRCSITVATEQAYSRYNPDFIDSKLTSNLSFENLSIRALRAAAKHFCPDFLSKTIRPQTLDVYSAQSAKEYLYTLIEEAKQYRQLFTIAGKMALSAGEV